MTASGDRCQHFKYEEADGVGHPAEGTFTYSDGSGHPCCTFHVKQRKGLAHGPGKFVPFPPASEEGDK